MKHPRKDPLMLADFFVFPDLMLSKAGIKGPGSSTAAIISSRDLIQIENLPPVVCITGPGDSGKTTLLKTLLKHYVEIGLYPLYIDCNRIGNISGDRLGELIRSSYEKQYTVKHLEPILTSSSDKKICLLDNFEGLKLDNDRTAALLDDFRLLILTASTPFLSEIYSSKFTQDKAPLNFELMEFSFDLKRELSKKWHNPGLTPERERETKGIDTKIESSLNMMEEAIGRDLAPSYPLILLTILNIGDSGKQEAPSQSSYAHYFEHLITKPIKESTGAEDLKAFMVYLAQLANLMFMERKSSVTVLELTELFEKQSGELRPPGRVDNLINTLLEAGTLGVAGSGYCFKYNYVYHYFTALYLARNLGLESVRDDIRRLCHNLGDWEHANIMLFLTHLSNDPLILEEITGALDASVKDSSPDSVDEKIREIDELIESIISTGDKDKKLRELRVEYASKKERTWVLTSQRRSVYEYRTPSDLELMRKHLENTHKDLTLLDITGELLKKRLRNRSQDPSTQNLAQTIYSFWLRSLGASSLNLLKTVEEPADDKGATYDRDNSLSLSTEEYMQEIERFTMAINIFGLYVKRLTRALGGIPLSELFDSEEERFPKKSFKLIEVCIRPWHRAEDTVFLEIESFTRAPGTGKFTRELVKQNALWHLRKLYSSTELESKLSELEKSLSL